MNIELPMRPGSDGRTTLTLLDLYAMVAMHAEFITSTSDATPQATQDLIDAAAEDGREPLQQIAHNAYLMAEAMLEARPK